MLNLVSYVYPRPLPAPAPAPASRDPRHLDILNLIPFSGENIACCIWNTFAVLQTSLR